MQSISNIRGKRRINVVNYIHAFMFVDRWRTQPKFGITALNRGIQGWVDESAGRDG